MTYIIGGERAFVHLRDKSFPQGYKLGGDGDEGGQEKAGEGAPSRYAGAEEKIQILTCREEITPGPIGKGPKGISG